jgi:DNA polymerase/3'-5' exonuclease PolX
MKLKLSLDDAKIQAEQLIEWLQPACRRIQIAGSIRRQVPQVGDIEIVAIPHYDEYRDMFGAPAGRISHLDQKLLSLCDADLLDPGEKSGPRYKQFILPRFGLQVDLFITDLERWGLIYTIRTGSAEFSRWLVTGRKHGGGLPTGMKIKDGLLWRGDQTISTPEERDVFEALNLIWIAPPQRKKGFWR